MVKFWIPRIIANYSKKVKGVDSANVYGSSTQKGMKAHALLFFEEDFTLTQCLI